MGYKEKVTSSSLSSVYVINKYDIFFHMTIDTRLELARLVLDSYLNPPATALFDNVVQKFGEKDWRIHKSWRIFKREVPNNLGYQIQDTYKTVGKDPPLEVTASGNEPVLPKEMKNEDVLAVSKFYHENKESSTAKEGKEIKNSEGERDRPLPALGDQGDGSYRRLGKEKKKVQGSVVSGSSTNMMVFVLVQYHREAIKLKPAHLPASPRKSKMYMQFCGAMHSSEDAQAAASAQLLNHKIANINFDHHRLQWKPFVGKVQRTYLISSHGTFPLPFCSFQTSCRCPCSIQIISLCTAAPPLLLSPVSLPTSTCWNLRFQNPAGQNLRHSFPPTSEGWTR